jgi:hypothetical protein
MTVLSLQWLLARPRHAAVTRWRRPPVPPERRTYPDPFFADPVAVEDDTRRMRSPSPPATH